MTIQEGALVAPTGQSPNYKKVTLTNTDDCATLNRFMTWSYITIQLSGTWTGTVTFEVTTDTSALPASTLWQTVSMTPTNSVTTATTATANGIWFTQGVGFKQIRARFSTASSGTPLATLSAVQSQY